MCKYQKNIVKSSVILAVIVILFLTGRSTVVYASKSSVSQQIAKLNREIKELQRNYKVESNRLKAQTKGCKVILFPKTISFNPRILSVYSLFTGNFSSSYSYFWVNNPGNLDLLGNGWVRLTGRYLSYNGLTCAECNAVKVTASPEKINKKIKQKKSEIKKLETKLKNSATLSDILLLTNKTKKISKQWKYSEAANKLSYKSLNSQIAIVDSNGKVTGKKTGNTVIVATDTVNGKKYKCKVTIGKPIKKLNFESDIYSEYYNDLDDVDDYIKDYDGEGRIVWLYLKADTKVIAEKVKISIDNKEDADDLSEYFVNKDGKLVPIYVKREGIFKVTAKTSSGLKATCDVYVYGFKVTDIKLEQPEIKVAIDTNSKEKVAFDLPIDITTDYNDGDFVSYYNDSSAGMPLISNSSDDNIVEVYDATIFPKKIGEATVTVKTFEGKKVTCKVIVVDRVGNEELFKTQQKSKYDWGNNSAEYSEDNYDEYSEDNSED